MCSNLKENSVVKGKCHGAIIAVARDVDVTTVTGGDCESVTCEMRRKSESVTANEISIAVTRVAFVT